MKRWQWFLIGGLLTLVVGLQAGAKMETYGNPRAKVGVKVYLPLEQANVRGGMANPVMALKQNLLEIVRQNPKEVYMQLIDITSPEARQEQKKGKIPGVISIWINGKNSFRREPGGPKLSKGMVVFQRVPNDSYIIPDVENVVRWMIRKYHPPKNMGK